MRVVQVATGAYSVPPAGAGAVEKSIHFLTKSLAELGCDVIVVDIGSEAHAEAETAVAFHEVPVPPLADRGLRHVIRISAFALGAVFKLRRLMRSSSVDVIHTHSQFPGAAIVVAKRLFRWSALHVHTCHNPHLLTRPTAGNRIKHVLENVALRKANHVVALTNDVQGRMVSTFGLDPARITVIPNGVELDDILKFREDSGRRNSQRKMLLCPARICPRKNQQALVEAAPQVLAAHPDTLFVLAGPVEDAGYLDTLKRLIHKKGLSDCFAFAGEVSREGMYRLYQDARILVFPTLYEVQPLVHLEAMAFGLPVVASRIREIEETMQSGEASAILVAPNNPDEIAQAILQLLGDEALRHQLSASGQKLVAERFNWMQIAGETLNLYAQLAERESREQR